MKKIHLVIFLFVLLQSCNNELTCKDFKTGRFFIPENKELLEFTSEYNDSISNYTIDRDKSIKRYLVIRKSDIQVEWINGENIGKPVFEKIEWIDDCSYRLTYDENKMELDEYMINFNKNNGIHVEMIGFVGNCVKYKASLKSKEGELLSQMGTFCKE